MPNSDNISKEFKAFGFVTNIWKRGFILGLISSLTFSLGYVFIQYKAVSAELIRSKAELVNSKEQQRLSEARLYERLINYFEPKMQLIDSVGQTVKVNINRQDSIQKVVIRKLKNTN